MSRTDGPKGATTLAARIALARGRRDTGVSPRWSIDDVDTLLGVADSVEPGLAGALEEMALRITDHLAAAGCLGHLQPMIDDARQGRNALQSSEYEAMQRPGVAEALLRAFNATPYEMGEAARRQALGRKPETATDELT